LIYPNAHHFQYGVPWYIITDNRKPFVNKLMTSRYAKFKFAQHKSSMYNAPVNDLTEAFIRQLAEEGVSKCKCAGHERIGEVLWV